MSTKPILAFDCATIGASIALSLNGEVHARAIGQTQQAAELVPTVDALLKEYGVKYNDLDCIVTTIGPGSFTGARIGLAAMHGMVLVAKTPLKIISTLEAAAWHQAEQKDSPQRFTITLRAGKGEVYAQDFELAAGKPSALSDIRLEPETKTDWALPHFSHAPDAAVMCRIAPHLPVATLADAVPLYIRPPDAIVPQGYAWLSAN